MRWRPGLLLGGVLALVVAAAIAYWRSGGVWFPSHQPEAHLVYLEGPEGATTLVGDGTSTKMRSFPTDVPSTRSWRIRIPARARLETHLSFDRAQLDQLVGLTCRVRVEVATDDGPRRILVERSLRPGSRWEPVLAELDAYGDRLVDLRLGLDCPEGGAGRAWPGAARWSVPVVSPPRSRRDVNVLLVSIDTLRADHLHSYGYPRATSPNIDRLARRGLLFRNAETVQSETWPALTSLHTSLYPSAHGVIWNGQRLGEGFVTLAQLLHAKHYSTSAFLTNMKRGRHPGFSRIFLAREGDQALEDRAAVEAAIGQLHLERDRRFFIWLHLISPHASYNPPAPYDTAFIRPGAPAVSADMAALARIRADNVPLKEEDLAHLVGLYDGEVAWVDELVGRLLATLRRLDLEKNTLVALTADHGEDLYEHNRYFFHSPSMYGSSLRIPLILALPRVLPAGEATDHPASIVDIAPTILGLLGLPAPSGLQGENLLPGRSLPSRPVRSMAFSETNGKIFGVRTADWRFVYNPEKLHPTALGGPYPIEETELFRQRDDHREQNNLSRSRADIARAFTAEILTWKARYLQKQVPSQGIDPEALEELRALGYVAN